MKKFTAKYQRDFEVDIEADDIEAASTAARQIVAQFPEGTCKLLSIYAEDYKPPPEDAPPPIVRGPGGKPTGGGSPGTPVCRQEILVDQVVKAA